ncbi:MAG TPA: phosphate ABC transporter permease PstA [Propionibacteriaceae bacterium]|nr:phosphate ABC transporter permease PstA [Propionibacteriaceae bacterium]
MSAPAPSTLNLQRPTGRRTAVDLLMRSLAWGSALIAIVPLVWILYTVISRGAPLLFSVEPTYTRLCTVAATPADRTEAAFQRVTEGDCAGGNPDASYRWVTGGGYVAVGQNLRADQNSVARDPSSRPGTVVGQPSGEGSGTIRIPSLQWWTTDVGAHPDTTPGGGVKHALIGTLWIGLISSAIAVPLGILGAVYLVEYARGRKSARVVSFLVDILTGVPSIVAALFIYAALITLAGFNRSAVAAALALVLLMLPTVLRSTEEMLKLVPDSLREASYALGVPKWKTILNIVIPTAFKGIATGVVLGMARVMGETAPLLILVNYARNTNWSPFSNTMGALPTMIANAANLPQTYPGADRGWGAAVTLILLVMGLNLLARWIGRSGRLKER